MACTMTVHAEEAIAVSPAADEMAGQTVSKPIQEPRPMENIGIAVVAPSGSAIPVQRYEKGMAVLQDRGFKVTSYYDPELHHERFAATDAIRLRQIKQAYQDPDVKIVMAVRGGYGASRLLKDLDFQQMAASGKVFVGYSDITVIQMGLLKYGAVSFQGPMVFSDYGLKNPSRYTIEHFEEVLSHPTTTLRWVSTDSPDVDVTGTFWGGNLAMISHLVGTKWMPDIEGGILFLEDVSEHPYRVERMLIQLDEAGILRKQKAIILGRFTEYRLNDEDNGYDFDSMLEWIKRRLPVPVITGLPFGHTKEKATLPIGAKAHLKVQSSSVKLHLSGYPTIKP